MLMTERWPTVEAHGGWPIQIPTREENFFFLSRIGEKESQVQTSTRWRSRFLPSVGTLILNYSWIEFMKLKSSLTWLTSQRKSMSSSWHTSSKEEPHCGTSYTSQGGGKASHLWWYGGAWSNSYKVNSFHLIINRSFTTNLSNADKSQELLRVHRGVLPSYISVQTINDGRATNREVRHGLRYTI